MNDDSQNDVERLYDLLAHDPPRKCQAKLVHAHLKKIHGWDNTHIRAAIRTLGLSKIALTQLEASQP